jgi:hypothetical protein
MTDKFDAISPEDDPTVIHRHVATFGEIEVLYEKWAHGEIAAESVIFDNKDIEEFGDEEIKSIVNSSSLVEAYSNVTIKRYETGYTIANFNQKARFIVEAYCD